MKRTINKIIEENYTTWIEFAENIKKISSKKYNEYDVVGEMCIYLHSLPPRQQQRLINLSDNELKGYVLGTIKYSYISTTSKFQQKYETNYSQLVDVVQVETTENKIELENQIVELEEKINELGWYHREFVKLYLMENENKKKISLQKISDKTGIKKSALHETKTEVFCILRGCPTEKKCIKCNQTKPITAYNKSVNNKDGHRNDCRQCQKIRRKKQ